MTDSLSFSLSLLFQWLWRRILQQMYDPDSSLKLNGADKSKGQPVRIKPEKSLWCQDVRKEEVRHGWLFCSRLMSRSCSTAKSSHPSPQRFIVRQSRGRALSSLMHSCYCLAVVRTKKRHNENHEIMLLFVESSSHNVLIRWEKSWEKAVINWMYAFIQCAMSE